MAMWTLAVPWWELVVRSVVIYLALIVALRIFGKRQIGQFTIFDLALILLVANAVQPAMTGPGTSLLRGLIIIAPLVVVDGPVGMGPARLRARSRPPERPPPAPGRHAARAP